MSAHRHRRLFAVVFLASLTLVEVGARLLEPAFPDRVVYYHVEAQVKVEQLRRFQAEGERFDVVFAGSSLARNAFVPEVVATTAPGLRSYNAGLSGAGPYAVRRFIVEEVVPRVHPRTVVYGLSDQDLAPSSGTLDESARSYRRAPATNRSLLAGIHRGLDDLSALSRARVFLRDPVETFRALRRRVAGTEPPSVLQRWRRRVRPSGEQTMNTQDVYVVERPDRRAHADPDRGRFRMSDSKLAELEALLEALRGWGIELVIVDMPITADRIALHPEGEHDYARYQQQLRRWAAEQDVPVVDATRSVSWERTFLDSGHLNKTGRVKFSAWLGTRLDRLRAP